MRKIPHCMSTQHPDNVNPPFFAANPELGGEDEIQEAYYAFSHLGCDEQMWDIEGKEVDNFVVKKLLSRYNNYFSEHVIGEEVFITIRVPNPRLERTEAKILLETLESIPRSFDTAQQFYGKDIAPIFEVIQPMTTSHTELENILHYYKDFVAGKESRTIWGKYTIKEWIGEFYPKSINVIPLVEDKKHLLLVADIVEKYLDGKDIEDQRVFLARSDPAMNYGFFSAIILNKIALQRLDGVRKETGVGIHPIIGVGSAPFRGNLCPSTVDSFIDEYPSVETYTLQSAFKYDNHPQDVEDAIKVLMSSKPKNPRYVDEDAGIKIVEKYSEEYRRQIIRAAPLINQMAKYIPSRRKRKLHISLFGYSRNMGGVALPRAISFTASLYSMGFPPELMGLTCLDDADIDIIKRIHINFDSTMASALEYYNPEADSLLGIDMEKTLQGLGLDYGHNEAHREITSSIIGQLRKNNTENLDLLCLQAANIRKFLG